NWARAELELASALIENRDAGDIAWQQVGCELNALERAANGASDGFCEHCFADAGDILNEEVAAAQNGNECQAYSIVFADDDALDVGDDPVCGLADLANGEQRTIFQSHAR